jgi:O-antigen ligase
MRRYLLFVVALLAFCGAVIGLLASIQQRNFHLRGYVNPTETQDIPFRPDYRFGVNAALTQYTPEELEIHLDLMQQIGVTWIRQPFSWAEVEQTEGQFDWDAWDRVVEAVDAREEMQLIAVLTDSPNWTRESTLKTAPPRRFEAYENFVAAVASRYGNQIDHYQIWDEPNIALGWGNLQPSAVEYAALLQVGYDAVHDYDPDATVIAAALAPTTEVSPRNISDIAYLRQLYAAGASQYADAFAAKPYGFSHPVTDRRVANDHLNFSRIIALREIMTAHGDGQKQLWASNWGWNNLPDAWKGGPSIWGEVSEEDRIAYTLAALDRSDSEWPWLGGMTLQHWQPDMPADDAIWGFSLINQDGTPSSLYNALARRTQTKHATNGLYAVQNDFARYRGVWSFSDFGADMGWVQDSSFSFDFAGDSIALLVRQDDYIAYFYPEIEEATANALPRDVAGNPYLLLRSGDLAPDLKLVKVAHDLPDEPRTMYVTGDELIPDEINHRWPLVGFAVSHDDFAAPYERQITIGWLTVIVAAFAVVVTGYRIQWSILGRFLHQLEARIGDIFHLLLSIVASLALLFGMILTWGDGVPAILRRDSVHIGLSVLTSGLIYIDTPSIIITLVPALILLMLIFARLEIGLLLTIFWAPFFLYPVELYRFAFPIAEIILFITVCAWLLRGFIGWGNMWRVGKVQATLAVPKLLDYLIIAWVLLGAVAVIWSPLTGAALTELRTMFIQPALFYAILRTINPDRLTFVRLVDGLLLAGLVVVGIGLLMYAQGEGTITAEAGARRLASVYGSPNNVGLLLGRCLPFLLAYMLLPVGRRRRTFATVAIIILLIALLLTQSAGALFIGIPAAVLLVFILSWRKRALLPIIALGVIFVGGIFVASQLPRFERMTDFSEGTNFYRLRVWESAINLIVDRPITGAGLDQFLYEFRDTYILPDAWEEPELSHPHNFLLDSWVRLGLFGVVLFVATQIAFWRRSLRSYFAHYDNVDPILLALIIGTMGSMLNLLAHGLVDNSIYVLDLAYIYVLLVGLCVSFENARAIDA